MRGRPIRVAVDRAAESTHSFQCPLQGSRGWCQMEVDIFASRIAPVQRFERAKKRQFEFRLHFLSDSPCIPIFCPLRNEKTLTPYRDFRQMTICFCVSFSLCLRSLGTTGTFGRPDSGRPPRRPPLQSSPSTPPGGSANQLIKQQKDVLKLIGLTPKPKLRHGLRPFFFHFRDSCRRPVAWSVSWSALALSSPGVRGTTQTSQAPQNPRLALTASQNPRLWWTPRFAWSSPRL